MGGNSTSCRGVFGIVRKSHLSAPGGRCSLKIGKRLEFPLDLTGCAWLLVLVRVLVCWIRPLKQINEVQHPSHDGILTPERLEPSQPVFFSQYLLSHLVPFNQNYAFLIFLPTSPHFLLSRICPFVRNFDFIHHPGSLHDCLDSCLADGVYDIYNPLIICACGNYGLTPAVSPQA